MNLKMYSLKAITCCISKAMLRIASVAGVMAFVLFLAITYSTVPGGLTDTAWGIWIGRIFMGLKVIMVLLFVTVLFVGMCSKSIGYCQVAVDTGRRPWYWLPKIGNPLPPKEMLTCESCGNTSPETDDEYRERLGLPPLDGAQRRGL